MKNSRRGILAQSYSKVTKNKLVLSILSLISMLAIAIAFTATSIYLYGQNYTPIQADAAIILGAAVWGEKPSPVFRERINHAVNLYKNGHAPILIFTGGVGNDDELAEALIGKRYAVSKGVKTSDILMETTSHTTYQNLQNASEIAAVYSLKKVLIVSDPLHLKRAVLMARNFGLDAHPSPTLTTRYQSLNSQLPFLMRETYFYFVYLLFKI